VTDKAIQCLQCYSYGETYLFVNDSVEAIVPLEEIHGESKHDWHLGQIYFNGTDIPVIHLALQGKPTDKLPHSHMMIIKCLGATTKNVAIVIGQIARPVDIFEQDLSFDGEPKDYLYPSKGPSLIGHIVDVDKLSQRLVQAKILD
jgi:hypothetical protein